MFPSSPPTPDSSQDADAELVAAVVDEPSEGAGATTIFPGPRTGMAQPPPSPHAINLVAPTGNLNPNDGGGPGQQLPLPLPPAPQVGVQHRPPELVGPQPAMEGIQNGGGGGPLLIDRAILIVLLALLACVVRKIA